MGRSIVTILLILVVFISISPQAREKMGEGWQSVKPAVVQSMDEVYTAIRALVAGDDSHNRTKDAPLPPGINFNVIVT